MKKIQWHKVPLRKPLAVYTACLIAALTTISVLFKLEINTNAADLLRWLGVTCVGGYYTTSTVEAITAKADIDDKEKPEKMGEI